MSILSQIGNDFWQTTTDEWFLYSNKFGKISCEIFSFMKFRHISFKPQQLYNSHLPRLSWRTATCKFKKVGERPPATSTKVDNSYLSSLQSWWTTNCQVYKVEESVKTTKIGEVSHVKSTKLENVHLSS